MFSKTLTVAAAVIAAASIAGTAEAAVIDTDAARITAAKYDFGGSTYAAGAPTGSGDLEFKLSGGKVTPRLTGTLHLNEADGTCARMQLRYFDRQGVELVDPKRGGIKCETDDQHHASTSTSTRTATTRSRASRSDSRRRPPPAGRRWRRDGSTRTSTPTT